MIPDSDRGPTVYEFEFDPGRFDVLGFRDGSGPYRIWALEHEEGNSDVRRFRGADLETTGRVSLDVGSTWAFVRPFGPDPGATIRRLVRILDAKVYVDGKPLESLEGIRWPRIPSAGTSRPPKRRSRR